MKTLAERVELDCSAKHLWSILSDVGRCDWVPTIEKITLSGDCRLFEMEGMGTITEKILLKDNDQMILQYSAIETPAPIEHHLATICGNSFSRLFTRAGPCDPMPPSYMRRSVATSRIFDIGGLDWCAVRAQPTCRKKKD